MGIRDEEIKRLEKYAQGLGLPVVWKEYSKGEGNAAAVVMDEDGRSAYLEMFVWPGKSKTQIILDFLHELAHQLAWIYRGRKDSDGLLTALSTENPSKKQRKMIYEMEKADAEYRIFVYHEVDIKIPKAKLEMDIAMDIWMYRQWYLRGKFPSRKEVREQERKIWDAKEAR